MKKGCLKKSNPEDRSCLESVEAMDRVEEETSEEATIVGMLLVMPYVSCDGSKCIFRVVRLLSKGSRDEEEKRLVPTPLDVALGDALCLSNESSTKCSKISIKDWSRETVRGRN